MVENLTFLDGQIELDARRYRDALACFDAIGDIDGSIVDALDVSDDDHSVTTNSADDGGVFELRFDQGENLSLNCLLYTSPSPRD